MTGSPPAVPASIATRQRGRTRSTRSSWRVTDPETVQPDKADPSAFEPARSHIVMNGVIATARFANSSAHSGAGQHRIREPYE